jgi:hypothetical protein
MGDLKKTWSRRRPCGLLPGAAARPGTSLPQILLCGRGVLLYLFTGGTMAAVNTDRLDWNNRWIDAQWQNIDSGNGKQVRV